MKIDKREKLITRLLKLPPVQWPRVLVAYQKRHKITGIDMDDLRRSLDDQTERCAFLSGYINARFYHGTNVRKAVEQGRKQQGKVIKALGYYPVYRKPFFESTEPSE